VIKADDIRGMLPAEIKEKVEDCKKDLYTLRVQAKTGKLEKQHRIQELRHDIARLLTIQHEMELKNNDTKAAPKEVKIKKEEKVKVKEIKDTKKEAKKDVKKKA
jgi:large subunit ribosomal protein L29